VLADLGEDDVSLNPAIHSLLSKSAGMQVSAETFLHQFHITTITPIYKDKLQCKSVRYGQ
jgi:hypothetical protein